MKKELLGLVLSMALLGGCGEGPTYPSTPHGGPAHDVRSYAVTYRVVGQFENAAVLYRDKYGLQVEVGVVRPGWSVNWNKTVDYTTNPFDGMSLMILAQDITGPGKNRTLGVEMWVNGQLVNSASRFNETGDAIVVQAHGGANAGGIFASKYEY